MTDDQHNSSGSNEDEKDEKFIPLDAVTKVIQEDGRWIVMLNVQSWEPKQDEHPVANNWNRINDYSTEAEAKVAASWIEKSANRPIRPPTGF